MSHASSIAGVTYQVNQTNASLQAWEMSEELRDEHFSQLSRDAFELKRQNRNQEALELYHEILKQEFVNASAIEKHVFLKFNCLKNSAELYERIGDFKMAKNHYTMALKINEKDPFTWTRLGFIEYEVFKELAISKRCFEAAIQTSTTFDRRSSRINVILMKLAEIYFQELDFNASEAMVDSILQRIQASHSQFYQPQQPMIPGQPIDANALFAYLLKSFFLSLKGDSQQLAQIFLARAKEMKPTAQIQDLDIIKKMKGYMKENLEARDIAITTTTLAQCQLEEKSQQEQQQVVVFKSNNQATEILIEPGKESYSSAIECIDDFLLQLVLTCEKIQAQGSQALSNCKLNFDTFIQTLSIILQSYEGLSSEQTTEALKQQELFYWAKLRQIDGILFNYDLGAADQNTNQQQVGQNQAQIGTKRQTKEQSTVIGGGNQRTLRRKPDSTEQQMKQYTVAPLKDYLDITLEKNYNMNDSSKLSQTDPAEFEEVISQREIMNAKSFFENQSQSSGEVDGKQQVNQQTNAMRYMAYPNLDSIEEVSQRLYSFKAFLNALIKLTNKSSTFTIRSLLRFCLQDTNTGFTNILNFNISTHLYRLFIVLVQGDLQKSNLEQIFGEEHTNHMLLTLFEVSLFNRHANKEVKSASLIYQKERLYEYFQNKEIEFIHSLDRKLLSNDNEKAIYQTSIRFFYAMMYYAFEIKNNMHASISYFQKLQAAKTQAQGISFPVMMPWVAMTFLIDESKVSDYGGVKITKAQIVKTNDEELIQLKQNEVKENEEAKRQNIQRQVLSRVKPELVKLACFYLDQLVHYLQKAYQSANGQGQSGATIDKQSNIQQESGASNSTNEEKIKEMWGKFIYSMCRCPTPKMIKLANYLFSVLTAFLYLSKQFYEQFIIKKLEFEPIFSELQERFKLIYNGVILDFLKKSNVRTMAELKQRLISKLYQEVVETNPSQDITSLTDQQMETEILKVLQKLQVHLLRQMSCEFLFHHVVTNIQNLVMNERLLQAYFHDLFFTEVFLTIMRSDVKGEFGDDVVEQFRPVLTLIKRLDKLSAKNNEVFIKAYFKLLITALPCVMGLFSGFLESHPQFLISNTASMIEKMQNQEDRTLLLRYEGNFLSEQNDMLQLVIQLSGYFFDIKFHQKDLSLPSPLKDAAKQVAEQDEEEPESEDERKKYKLKCLSKLKERNNRYWSVILNQLMPVSSGGGGSSSQANQSGGNQSGSANVQQLQYLYTVSGVLDVYLLKDMAYICNIIARGRFLGFGMMTMKDIGNVANFVDILCRYVMDNMKMLSEQKPHPNSTNFQEQSDLFKSSIDHAKGNPLAFLPSLDQLQQKWLQNRPASVNDYQAFINSVSQVTFMILNIATHLSLDNTAMQQIVNKTTSQKRRKLQEVAFNALIASGVQKFFKNLRSISQLDIVYSGFKIESLLIHGQVLGELFVQANNCKVDKDYRKQPAYISYKTKFNHALNTILVAIQELFIELRQQLESGDTLTSNISVNQTWINLPKFTKLKQAFSQSLYIISCKFQANKFLLKRSPQSFIHSGITSSSGVMGNVQTPQEIIERKVQKVRNLTEMGVIIANICEILEKLAVISDDPRIGKGKQKDILSAVLSIVETFISSVQSSSRSSLNDRVRFIIPSDRVQDFNQQVKEAVSSDAMIRQRLEQVKLKTSFEFPALQALFVSQLGKPKAPIQSTTPIKKLTHQKSFKDQANILKDTNSDFSDLIQLNRALEVAYTNQSPRGCLEIFIEVLRRAIHLGIILRYHGESNAGCIKALREDEISQLKNIHEQVTKRLLIGENRAIFRYILGQIQPSLLLSTSAHSKQDPSKVDEEVCEILDSDEEQKNNQAEEAGLISEILLDNTVSSSLVRQEIFITDEMPEFNPYETSLHSLYRLGDQLYQVLGSTTSTATGVNTSAGAAANPASSATVASSISLQGLGGVRVRLQYALVKELEFECALNPLLHGRIEQPVNEKLADMLNSVVSSLSIDDAAGDSLQLEDSRKNLLSQLRSTDVANSDLRIKVKSYFVCLNARFKRYEQIKEQFKRYQHLAKHYEKLAGGQLSSSAIPRTVELQTMFNLCKDEYLDTIFSRIKDQFELYQKIRRKLKEGQGQAPEVFERCLKTYKELRDRISVTKDQIPTTLKDIFDLFVDSHSRKSLLTQKRLVDESQKRQIRQSILISCAFCGPDAEFESNKVSSKFLDLARLQGDDDYEREGLQICIKWYSSILEERPNKRDIDTIKKLKAILTDDIEKQLKEAQLARANQQQQNQHVDVPMINDKEVVRGVFNEDPQQPE